MPDFPGPTRGMPDRRSSSWPKGDTSATRPIADQLVGEIWRLRDQITIDPVTPAQAMQELSRTPAGPGPVVIADFADNPGGGGYGDATGLLAAMIEADLRNAAMTMFWDPEAVEAAVAAGEGAEIDISLGGRIDPAFGAPLAVRAVVRRVTDGCFRLDGPMAQGVASNNGPSARLAVGGIDVCVSSRRGQAFDLQHFRHFGIEPETMSVLAVKSAQHFRAAYEPIARRVIVADDGGGLTSCNYRSLPYRNVRRPVYPLDLD